MAERQITISGDMLRERYTARDENEGTAYVPYCTEVCERGDGESCPRDCEFINEVIERLAQFEDAVEEASG